MADSGIIVYNDNSKLVLNNSYINFYVSRKIGLSGNGVTTGTFQSGEVLAAVGGINATTINAYCENSPSGWTCTVTGYQSGLYVYVLSTNVPDTAHGVGLEIFDASGKVIFNSNVNPARVLMFGHGETGLPTNSAYRYAIADGAWLTEWSLNNWWEQTVSHSQVTHPAVTGKKWVAEKTHRESTYYPDKYEMKSVYNSSTGKFEMQRVLVEKAHWEYKTVVDEPAHWETYTITAAWTEYITNYVNTGHTDYYKRQSNFSINNSRVALTVVRNDTKTNEVTSMDTGSISNRTMYVAPPATSKPFTKQYDYTINPCSFLLFDVSGC